MTPPAEFRRQAHALVDWIADYLDTLEARPVTPDTTPGATAARLPTSPPEHAEPFADIWRDFEDLVLPGMAHWQHPGWMAYFPASSSGPSILAEMATAALAAQCMSWQTSPAATELEQVTLEWLRQLIGLPTGFIGSIQDTASTATLVAVLSARERATGGGFAAAGASAAGAGLLVAYASEEAHSSVPKAVRLAGFGEDRLRRVPVDDTFALRPDRLAELMDADRAAGLIPACVVATVGSTSSTALDPLRPIGEHCARHGAWLHVDAAYAGSAAVCPEHRAMLDGVERADSFVFNPHKWLLTNFDCSAYFVRDPALLVRTFGTAPAYLRGAHDAEVPNYRDWGIQLGRRFRALKLWFVLRSLGVEGLREHIRKGIASGRLLERLAREEPGWEVVAPAPLALVCLRHAPNGASPEAADEHNRRILARVNGDRRFHLTGTILGGRQVIRVAVGGRLTEERHVRAVWEELRHAAAG
ncbi:MAG: pyridoxal phosphate-dependent decarboxylase family protein [Gemmatimonadales bacterium]